MSYLDYEKMEEAALMQIVKTCLQMVSFEGLKGDHHFYITFLTAYPGVELPEEMKIQFPEELTIVLQHQFENLEISKDYFQVDITFNKDLTTVRVPYGALINFYDPSVEFSIDFNPVIPIEKEAIPFVPGTQKGKKDNKVTGSTGKVISLDTFRSKNKK